MSCFCIGRGLVLHRWVYPEGREFICSQLPSRLLYWYVSRKVKQSTHGHGMGRHTRVEVFNILQGDIRALSDYLGERERQRIDKLEKDHTYS